MKQTGNYTVAGPNIYIAPHGTVIYDSQTDQRQEFMPSAIFITIESDLGYHDVPIQKLIHAYTNQNPDGNPPQT